MSKVCDVYNHFKTRNFKLTAMDEITERGDVIDRLFDEIVGMELQIKELIKFVENICYNDINKNDLNIEWVQKDAWELLNKTKLKCISDDPCSKEFDGACHSSRKCEYQGEIWRKGI